MAAFWICLAKVSQGFEYDSRSKYATDQNMARLMRELNRFLNMAEYILIMLNMLEYVWINRVVNMPEFWKCDAVQTIRSLWKLLSSYRDRDVFRHCQTFKMECFAKRIMPEFGWMSIGVPEYPKRSLKILELFWLCQGSEYGTAIYVRVTQSSEYVWIWLNMPQ